MSIIGRVVLDPSQKNVGKVLVRTANRTTISSPNFEPKVNVSIDDIQSVNVSTKRDGDVLLYDSQSGEFISSPLRQAQVDLENINGGTF
jgi:hypothetical protein